jgi:fumarate hydratase class I
MPNFSYSDLLPLGEDKTKYRLVSKEGVSVVKLGDKEFLQVEPSALEKLTSEAIHDINHYLRSEHLQQLTNIVKDPEASPNDRFVAIDLLKNANIAAGGILPMCQDTGTALVMGKKGQYVLTTGKDEVARTPAITCPPKSKSMPTAIIRTNTTCSTSPKVAAALTSHFCIKRPRLSSTQHHL